MNVSHFAWKASLRFALAIIPILLPTLTLGQSSLSDVIGVPPDATMYPIPGVGSVNLNNGNLHIEIPIRVVKDRNGTPLTTSITYDNSVWYVAQVNSPNWTPTNPSTIGEWTVAGFTNSFGWGSSLGVSTSPEYDGEVTNTTSTIACGTSTGTQYDHWQYKDGHGTIHPFDPNLATQQVNPACPSQITSIKASATDRSGYWLVVTNSTSATVYDMHGNLVNGYASDTNGNGIFTGGFLDRLGRSMSLPSDFIYTFKTINVRSDFNDGTNQDLGPLSATVISSLTLPDGRKYSFQYDEAGSPAQLGHYGSLTGITLPTGGQITINSEVIHVHINEPFPNRYYANFVLGSITTPDGTWSFSYPSEDNNHRITATAPVDPATGLASQTYCDCFPGGAQIVSVFSGTATGTPLRTVLKQTVGQTMTITTTLENGHSSHVSYTYQDVCTPRTYLINI